MSTLRDFENSLLVHFDADLLAHALKTGSDNMTPGQQVSNQDATGAAKILVKSWVHLLYRSYATSKQPHGSIKLSDDFLPCDKQGEEIAIQLDDTIGPLSWPSFQQQRLYRFDFIVSITDLIDIWMHFKNDFMGHMLTTHEEQTLEAGVVLFTTSVSVFSLSINTESELTLAWQPRADATQTHILLH